MILVKAFINGTFRISLSLSYLVDQQTVIRYTKDEVSSDAAQLGRWIEEQVREGESTR